MSELVFIRVRACGTDEACRIVSWTLAGLGKVVSKGRGTTQDPFAGWFVVKLRSGLRVEGVRWELLGMGLNERVDRIEEVACRREGSLLARQLALPGVS